MPGRRLGRRRGATGSAHRSGAARVVIVETSQPIQPQRAARLVDRVVEPERDDVVARGVTSMAIPR